MTLAGRLRAARYRDAIERCAAVCQPDRGPGTSCHPTRCGQSGVGRIVATAEHWGSLVRSGRAPSAFTSLAEFVNCVPSTSRQAVQQNGPAMANRSKALDMVRMTGGSTSTPIQLPAWKSQCLSTRDDMWCGPRWYGVDPGSRLFLMWGHGHWLGSGARGWIRTRRLEISDRLFGYRRFSAYDLQPDKMRRAAVDMMALRPDYVIACSVALDLLARANAGHASALRSLGVRVMVGRCNDCVILKDGFTVHSEVFIHAIRPCAAVRSFQVRQDGDDLRIHHASDHPLLPEQEGGILTRVTKIHPSLGTIRLERVAALDQTVAGKTRMIIRR
jgi:hypothetical protein